MQALAARLILALGFLCAAGVAAHSQTLDGRRVALVIGNGAYGRVPSLPNARNDAHLVANTLRLAGFELVGNAAQIDVSKQQFDRAIAEFGRAMRGADVALFYFSGHAVQVQGVNWLFPGDADPAGVADLNAQMIDAGLILREMEDSGTRLNMLVLDSCRDNPFEAPSVRATAKAAFRAKGLAEMPVPAGTLISYATQPGNVAADGAAGNSPYTTALAEAMLQRGLDVFQVFNRVGLAVKQATAGAQQPWLASSPIAGGFYFFGSAPSARPQGSDNETVFWQSIAGSRSPADYQAYLRAFPGGIFAELARSRITALAPLPTPVPSFQATIAPPALPSGEPRGGMADTEMGRWIVRPGGECASAYYTWRTVGNAFEFSDQSGQGDTERILDRRPQEVTTETVTSRRHRGPGQAVGTRWEYRFNANGTVDVRNASSGKRFTLVRCP